MPGSWVVRDAEIVTGYGRSHGDLAVTDGQVADIGPDLTGRFEFEINADGRMLIPGLIDPHVHFALPVAHRRSADDFVSGSRAAIHGGVTTIIDFTTPIRGMTLQDSIFHRQNEARDITVDYALHATVCGWDSRFTPDDVDACIRSGVVSFKFFTAYEESGRRTRYEDLQTAARAIHSKGGILLVHAEDQDTLRPPGAFPSDAFTYYEQSRPEESEAKAIEIIRRIQMETSACINIVHLSSGAGLDAAGPSGLKLETCPHYLVLSKEVFNRSDGFRYAVAPPLRSEESIQSVWSGLISGRIQTIGTDHCPFAMDDQTAAGNHFRTAPFGLPGVETSLPILVTHGVLTGRITWERLVELTSTNAAKMHGLFPRKGVLQKGSDADFVIVGDDRKIVSPMQLHSNTPWSPYTGMTLSGWPKIVVSRGEIVLDNGRLNTEPGRGLFLHREPLHGADTLP